MTQHGSPDSSNPASTSSSAVSAGPMSPMDLAWLRMDQPTNLMIISGLFFFDQPIDIDRMKDELNRRLLQVDRFRQRIRRLPNGKVLWEEDPHFDLDNHMVRVMLDPPADQAKLQEFVGGLMGEPFDESRPLWRFYLIEDYEGGCVLITRLHHCIGDGIALMLLLLSLTDLEPGTELIEGRPGFNPLSTLFSEGGKISEAVLDGCRKVMPEGMKVMVRPSGGVTDGKSRSRLVAKALGALTKLTFKLPDPKTQFKGPLGVDKRAVWSKPLDLERVRELKTAMDATINDVLLAAMTGGLRRYLETRGDKVDGVDFRAAVPVSLRKLEKLADLGNEFGLIFLPLPVGIGEPKARLRELKRRTDQLKGSFEAGAVYGVLQGMGMAPNFIHKLIVKIFGTKATTVMTNVPGPREALYFAGGRIRDIMFWVPRSGSVSMGISIISYAGRVRLGVSTDTGLVPDPETIIEGFYQEFDAMRQLGGLDPVF